MFHRLIITVFCLLLAAIPENPGSLSAHHNKDKMGEYIDYDLYSTPWVDSVFHSLSMEERIAQLLMIRVHTDEYFPKTEAVSDFMLLQLLLDKEQTYYDSIVDLIKKYNVGGVAFFSGHPERQLNATNLFQKKAKTPLLVAMDAEWGLGMRLDSAISYPKQITLGAITDDKLVYEMGMEIARQLRRIGVHINFAPVADVNSNPNNPVINFRSFGECRYNVARKSIAYMMGMQDWGIIANAKHFPGHGDTYTDSHYTLPVINHEHTLIDSVHLFPFKQLFDNGIKSVMTAHLHIPAYDDTKNLASTLSENVVTGLLQEDMGFNGLIITDALDMKGVSDYFESGELELKALMAGNDILLLPEDVPKTISTIKKAIKNGELSKEYVNNKCRKVLFYKEMSGLDNHKPLSKHNLHEDLNTTKAKLINKKLIENSITLIKNQNELLPVSNMDTLKIASLAIGTDTINTFQKYLNNYYPVDLLNASRDISSSGLKQLVDTLNNYNLVIISLHNNSIFPTSKYGINGNIINLIENISKSNNVVLNLFANPYILNFFDDLTNIESLLISYEDGDLYETASAQIIFGGLPAKGKLPVSATPFFPVGTSIETPKNYRIRHRSPEEAGLSPYFNKAIDSIVIEGINNEAYPGAQVVVIKGGDVILNRSYGYHTYEQNRKVKNSDIYDIASLTKIGATTTAVMHLTDRGYVDVENSIDYYLPWLKGSNFEGIGLADILAHQAKLRSWIPFYLETIGDKCDTLIYSDTYSDDYPVEVAESLFIHKNYRDTIFSKILEAPLNQNKAYRYSDLGFYLLAELVKELSGMSLDEYMDHHFYKPMGLHTMTFNPLKKFEKSRIVPTENDTLFRQQLIHGHVHDPGAAMLGGVSGHAGLFSNALDMAVMMQLFLQKGYYAGHQFLEPNTINEFTKAQFLDNDNRRGLGFDKPGIDQDSFPACKNASSNSFGHTGFTGTFAWADPEEDLVFVFLSNRIHPSASNRKLIDMNIRAEIQQAIYDAILKNKYLESRKIQ